MSPRAGLGRRATDLFFTKQRQDSTVYLCRCGVNRKSCRTSYQNLRSNFQTAHPNYLDALCSDDSVSQERMEKYFKSSKTAHIYGWIDYILNGLLPFSHVQKPVIRKHNIHDSISLTTFMKYMRSLTKSVERKIVSLIPQKFWRLRFFPCKVCECI